MRECPSNRKGTAMLEWALKLALVAFLAGM